MAQIIPIYIPTYINNAEYSPTRVLPRLLFFNGLIDCQSYYIESASLALGGITYEQNAFPYFDNYNVISGSQFPTTDSKSLLFNNEAASYGEIPNESLYTQYWEKYVEFLYNPTTRVLNCSAIIPLADYFHMELNDIVNFKGNYWHLRAINDYSLKTGECNLQLLGPVIPDVFDTIPAITPSSSVSWSYTEDGQNGEFKIYDNATTVTTLTANGSGNALIAPGHYVTASLVPVSYSGPGVTMSLNVNGGTTLAVTAYSNTTITASFLANSGLPYTITGSILYNVPATDPDAAKFIEATGISGSNANAVNGLVLDLKSYNLWEKMKAVYPLVGATSSSTSYNLIDTGSFRIGWTGSVTFNTNYVQGNGTTGFGNTNLSPNPVLTTTASMHMSTYIITSSSLEAYDMGVTSFPPFSFFAQDSFGASGSLRYASFNSLSSGRLEVTDTTKIGYFVATNLANTSSIYLNGSSLGSGSKTLALDALTVTLMAERQSTGPGGFSDRRYGLFTIGAGLNTTQVTNLNTSVTQFVTSLGRNV
jgi:hypothetical protein